MKRLAASTLLVAALVAPPGASAAVDIFAKFDGMRGESLDERHREWIDVLSYSWGASSSGSFQSGGGGGAGKVNFQDFNFTKMYDASSAKLLESLAKGTHLKEGLFDLVQVGGKIDDPFLQYKFTDVLITSYQVGSGGDFPTETVSFTFGEVETRYRKQDEKGGMSPPINFVWDVKKNTGAADVPPVPEPSTWAMLMAGLLCVVYFGRNRVRGRELAT
jgi:type VI secretion system secreted protein Hcp